MVIDATMWFAEADMMRLRLKMLDPLVDTFVIVEADRTHTGELKGWNLPEDIVSHPKVVYRQVSLTAADAWGREHEQRRQMRESVGWLEPSPDTTVVMSDCDEIWDERLLPVKGLRAAQMDFRIFSIWWRYSQVWAGSIAATWEFMSQADWQVLRNQRWQHRQVRSGWHLSWMGDDEFLRHKLASFAHTELAHHDLTVPTTAGAWLDGSQMHETDDGLPSEMVEFAPESWKRRRVS